LRERLGAGALEFRRAHFDWKKNASTLAEFYERILAQTPAQRHATNVTVPE
jgi:glycosyltransferase involved in cell wall biosynthesis